MEKSPWITAFVDVYQNLSKDNLDTLKQVYHPRITFQDPLHKVEGLAPLTDYFQHLYQNVISCQFSINKHFEIENGGCLYWTMSLRHPSLNRGNTIFIEGHSLLEIKDGLVISHRDYFDIGSMLYEQLPLLGNLIKYVKRRASS